MRATQLFELCLVGDRNPIGIERTGEQRRVAPAGDTGDLCCGEGDDFNPRIVTKDHIKVMKFAARRTDDNDAPPLARARPAMLPRCGGWGSGLHCEPLRQSCPP
jgi:hypothetical protein